MSKNKLFTPFQLASNIALKHRVALAPMTRSRADVNGVQPEYASTYYEQRASTPGTFLITEATQVSQEGQGYVLTPGIYTKEHVESWKKIVDTVHKKNSYIAAQLWHVGRLSHPSFQKDNELPVAPSAIAPKGDTYTKNFEKVPYVVPRELTVGDIQRIIGEFEHAAKCAKEAGFRFVELHSGNGYLLDQFLQDGTNKRKDLYGGSYANRSRFLLELVNAVKSVYGAENIGVRLSPWGSFGDMSESNTVELFSHVISELDKSKIGYLHLVEPGAGDGSDGKFLPQQSSNTFRPLLRVH